MFDQPSVYTELFTGSKTCGSHQSKWLSSVLPYMPLLSALVALGAFLYLSHLGLCRW